MDQHVTPVSSSSSSRESGVFPKAAAASPSHVADHAFSRFGAEQETTLRRRAREHGVAGLDDIDVLALLLSRVADVDMHAAAAALVSRFGSAAQALGAPLHDLSCIVGADAAFELKLQHDLLRRVLELPFAKRDVISSWSALLAYLRHVMAAEPREHVRCLFLDKKNQLIADEIVGIGTVDHAPVYPREIIRRALELNSCAIILAHQHPSGDPTPSAADIQITKEVVEAAKALRIALHDHVVVGAAGTASFKALGLL